MLVYVIKWMLGQPTAPPLVWIQLQFTTKWQSQSTLMEANQVFFSFLSLFSGLPFFNFKKIGNGPSYTASSGPINNKGDVTKCKTVQDTLFTRVDLCTTQSPDGSTTNAVDTAYKVGPMAAAVGAAVAVGGAVVVGGPAVATGLATAATAFAPAFGGENPHPVELPSKTSFTCPEPTPVSLPPPTGLK